MHYYTCIHQLLGFTLLHGLLLTRDQERMDYYPRATQQRQHNPTPRRFVNLQLAVLSSLHRQAKSAHQKRSRVLHLLQPGNVLILLEITVRITYLMSILERQLRYVVPSMLTIAAYHLTAAPTWP